MSADHDVVLASADTLQCVDIVKLYQKIIVLALGTAWCEAGQIVGVLFQKFRARLLLTGMRKFESFLERKIGGSRRMLVSVIFPMPCFIGELMKYDSIEFSKDVSDNSRVEFQVMSQEESRQEHLARSLQVLERQRRIAERLAAFELDMQERAARAVGGIFV